MFFLIYLQYPPKLYQEEAKNTSGGFRETHMFGKYEFRPIDWQNEKRGKNILYVGRPDDFGGNEEILKLIYFLDGKEAIWIIEG